MDINAARAAETTEGGLDKLGELLNWRDSKLFSDAGRAQVRQLGEDFRRLAIPVGKVLSSQYCRCWQHAEAMFGKGGYQITEALSLPKSYPAVTAEDRKLKQDALRAMLAEAPTAGTNTVLISHGNNVLML